MAQATFLTLPQTAEWPEQGTWTYEDYLRLPDDGRRYEIIKGVLYMANAPSYEHQYAVGEIARQMSNFVIDNNLGRVVSAPFEVHLAEDIRPVQPDILFIQTSRLPTPSAKNYEGPPDLIVEVLSNSTARQDRVTKFTAYEQTGVNEYWIVNPKTRSVEVFTLSRQEYALVGEFVADNMIESKVLTGLQIRTSSLFAS
jgi:Uma2 family endonuclease